MKLSEIQYQAKKTFLFYGDAGVGKTILSTSFPGPLKVFDFDNKISSAANFYKGDTERLELIDVSNYTVDQSSKHPYAKRPFRRFIDDFNKLAAMPENEFPFKTVIIDSLTSFAEQLMQEEMAQNADSKRQAMMNVSVPHLKDYQVSIAFCKEVIKQFLSLPCNVVMTAHLSTDKDELTGAIAKQIAIWGKDLPGWIPKMFEEVYHLYAKDESGTTKYFARTRPGDRFNARSQLKNIPTHLCIDKGFKALEEFF